MTDYTLTQLLKAALIEWGFLATKGTAKQALNTKWVRLTTYEVIIIIHFCPSEESNIHSYTHCNMLINGQVHGQTELFGLLGSS